MNQNTSAQLNNVHATSASDSGTTLFTDVADILDTVPYEKSLKTARTWLYVVAAFQTAMGFYEYATTPDPRVAAIALAIDAFIGAVFLMLALWSRKNPVTAFTTALIFYVVVVTVFMMLDASNFYKGLLVKIVVVVALVKANRDARRYAAVKASLGTAE